jgi:hypothetical protein
MATRRIVGDSPAVRDTEQSLTVRAEDVKALTTDIAAQLSNLPTVITDDATCRRAKESLPMLKRAEDKVITFFEDIKAAASRAHKTICAKEHEQLAPIKSARQRIASLVYLYEQEQARIKREQERKAQEEEKRRREEAALAEAEAVAATSPEIAEQILLQEIAAPAPVVILPPTKVEVDGVGSRENWQFKYVGASPGQKWKDLTSDQQERVRALIPRDSIVPDEVAIGRIVKAKKSATRIPGIEVYDAGTVSVRG